MDHVKGIVFMTQQDHGPDELTEVHRVCMRFLQTLSMKSGGVHKITPLAEKLLATDSCWRERKTKEREGRDKRKGSERREGGRKRGTETVHGKSTTLLFIELCEQHKLDLMGLKRKKKLCKYGKGNVSGRNWGNG